MYDRVRDSLARRIRRVGPTPDLERVALHWSKQYEDKRGTDKMRVARIDVVAPVPDRDGLQWLDVTVRRPKVVANDEGGKLRRLRRHPGRERKKRTYGNRNEIGPDTVKPISFEFGGKPGPPTVNALQGLTTKPAEARGGGGG